MKTKYQNEYSTQARDLCLLGATDQSLADFFEINIDTLDRWKKRHSEFREAIKAGKLAADSQVASALFRRAVGFEYDSVTYEKIVFDADDQTEVKTEAWKKKVVTKMVIPDIGACMNWLTNRQRGIWSDVEIDRLSEQQYQALLQKIKKDLK